MADGREANPGAHFDRTRTRESSLTRKGRVHIERTSTGYRVGAWQAHHILCVDALESRSFSDTDIEDFAEACLWTTVWDINDGHNMVGMPVRSDYKDNNGVMGMDICCHANDHNTTGGYTGECKDYLQVQVWNKIKKKKNAKDHITNPESLKAALKAATTKFRGLLNDRAEREKGTLVAWTKRHDPGWENKWYKPFSMAKNSAVVPRQPGTKSNIATKMANIFLRIK